MRHEHLRRTGLLAVLAVAAAGSGCASMNNTERGAVGGGVVGTAGGALIGNDIDKQERRDRDVARPSRSKTRGRRASGSACST